MRLSPRKYHGTSLEFFATVCQVLPFPIRKVHVDNGTEFSLAFALAVQEAGVRLRYLKPRRPEQNDKVERSHRVDEEEFWSRHTFEVFSTAATALLAWERRYNLERFSLALQGLTPEEKLATCRLGEVAPPPIPLAPHVDPRPTSSMNSMPIVDPRPHAKADCSSLT